jgi:hypothetical protein
MSMMMTTMTGTIAKAADRTALRVAAQFLARGDGGPPPSGEGID